MAEAGIHSGPRNSLENILTSQIKKLKQKSILTQKLVSGGAEQEGLQSGKVTSTCAGTWEWDTAVAATAQLFAAQSVVSPLLGDSLPFQPGLVPSPSVPIRTRSHVLAPSLFLSQSFLQISPVASTLYLLFSGGIIMRSI